MQNEREEDPEDAERELLLAWIDANWDEIASFAWKCYVTQGRGIVLLRGDWKNDGDIAIAYQTPTDAEEAGTVWPDELIEAASSYAPGTDILFLVQESGSGTLLGLRAAPPRLPPREAGQRDGSPPLVPSA